MSCKRKIARVIGREILDSRGNPTTEAEVILEDGTIGTGKAPSGASTGLFEALELRDKDNRYSGKGVSKAVAGINGALAQSIIGTDVCDSKLIDYKMLEADGTKEKSKVGANAILAVSLACADAAAKSLGIPLYRHIGGINAAKMPLPMMNILNGGAHAGNNIDIQEFMIIPVGACCFKEGLRMCAEVFHTLAKLLKKRNLSTSVGDEGGYAPQLDSEEQALDLIIEAVTETGYKPKTDFMISIDAAASEWKGKSGGYLMPKSGQEYTTEQLIEKWEHICEKYPVFSIEDPLDEEDWDGWTEITRKLGNKILLVGDDLFVTNTERIKKGIDLGCANAVLIKLNQIGSLSETMAAVRLAAENGYRSIISHRSGETEDTFIADLSVALNTGLIKTGAPSRGERTAKYNRLLKIEEEIKG